MVGHRQVAFFMGIIRLAGKVAEPADCLLREKPYLSYWFYELFHEYYLGSVVAEENNFAVADRQGFETEKKTAGEGVRKQEKYCEQSSII